MSARILEWHPSAASLGHAVAALGVFDGVHVGHAALVRDAVALARDRGAVAAVITFDRDPDRVLRPATAAPQLLDLDDKLAFLSELGPDHIVVVPFDDALAELEPYGFLDEVLCRATDPVEVVVGYDFRFGRAAAGDVDTLVHFGRDRGFGVLAHELVSVGGEPVTSTRIRSLIAEGDVGEAADLLGRPHRIRGEVVHGRGGGVALGIPTANLRIPGYAALPLEGVYAGTARVDASAYPAGISVGVPPTFPEGTCELEAHLIGFEGDLYGRDIVLEFTSRLRDQRTFAAPEELAEAIRADLDRVREGLG